jgi:hypothetical protein
MSSSLPRAQVILKTSSCVNFPSPKYVTLTWAGPLFPSGRQARAARGPQVPVPVAILAAGQGLGGSDVLSGQKKPATSQIIRAEVTLSDVGGEILEPSPQSFGSGERLFPGRYVGCAGSDVVVRS